VENAAPLAALAAVLLGLGFVIRVSVASWLRVKQFERDAQRPLAAPGWDAADLAARLARIEQVVEATAVEVERLGEGQRYAARLLAEPRAAAPAAAPAPARVVTPH
jgi:hypothetical protein